MAKFKKAMLGTGNHHAGDKILDVTADRLTHWKTLFDGMKTKGIKVPMAWGHAENPADSQPFQMGKTKAGSRRKRVPLAKDCVGYLDAFEIHADGDKAELTFDIPRQSDVSMVENNLADVSPVIFKNWKDGDGTAYEDVITHVDLVQHPVDHKQGQFEAADTIACSLSYFEDDKPELFRLQTDDDESDGDESKDSDDADDAEDETGTTDEERITSVIESLATMQIMLSPDTNRENFLEHLQQALLTANAMGGDEVSGEQSQLTPTTPDVQAMSAEHNALKAHSTQQHRLTVGARLTSLVETGRCTPAEVKQQGPLVDVIELSLDDKGNHKDSPVETWLQSREAVPAGTFWDSSQRTAMSSMSPVDQPGVVHGETVTEEEADDIVDAMFGKK